jgi:hypothetical protein
MSVETGVAVREQKNDSDEWEIPGKKVETEDLNQIFGVDSIDRVIATWSDEILEEINTQANTSEAIPMAISEMSTEDKVDTNALGRLMDMTDTRLDVLEALNGRKEGNLDKEAKAKFRALLEILSVLTECKKQLETKIFEPLFLIALIHDVLQNTLTKELRATELIKHYIDHYTQILKQRFEELYRDLSNPDQEKG